MIAETSSHHWSEWIQKCLADSTRRCAEMFVLCDPEIRHLAQYWGMYLGRQSTMIEQRLAALGVNDPNSQIRNEVIRCLNSRTGRGWGDEFIDLIEERAAFETYEQRTGSRNLRCESCGYHFRSIDLGEKRRVIAEDAGLELNQFIHPKRLEDELKPISVEGKDRELLRCELDHIIPKLGLGASHRNNLQVLCRFCNVGKSHYRYAGESFAEVVSASACVTYGTSTSFVWVARIAVLVFAMAAQVNTQGVPKKESEFSVRFKDPSSKWLVPWNLELVAYE